MKTYTVTVGFAESVRTYSKLTFDQMYELKEEAIRDGAETVTVVVHKEVSAKSLR